MAARKPSKPTDDKIAATEDVVPTQDPIDSDAAGSDEFTGQPPTRRSDLGMLSLEIPPGWKFFPLDDSVIGRPLSNVGVLVIKQISIDKVPANASHEIFMSLAREASGYVLSGPGLDPARERIGCCYAGGESFNVDRDFVRVWYSHRPEGLIVAWFGTRTNRMVERPVKQLVGQCDKIIASARLPAPPEA